MKYCLFFLALVFLGLTSCNPDTNQASNASKDKTFDTFKEQFIEQLWEVEPEWATYLGNYKYADVLTIPDEKHRKTQMDFIAKMKKELAAIDINELSPNNKTDYKMIQNLIESTAWNIKEFKIHEWNPAQYNVGGSINKILISDYAPLNQRLKDMTKKMENVPAYFEAAKANIKNPSLEHLDLALQQNEGALSIFGDKLTDSLKLSTLSQEEKELFKNRVVYTKAAIDKYLGFLNQYKKENEGRFRDFRIGKEMFSKKFEYDIVSEYTAEQMYEKALAHKTVLHEKMVKIAHDIWDRHMGKTAKPENELEMVQQLIDKVAERHVERADFIKSIRGQIPELAAFVKEKDLLYLDPTKPLEVRPTPEYMRGFAGASISSPGPFDKGAPTFYNVTPLDHYTPEDAESYLKEYNHYVLQILNIHEAIPGHYAQLVYANKSPSLIKSILGNGAMIEGWAVYTELMMLEEGYGDHEPEMWLMYHKWNLRVTCNTIIDYGIHALKWEKEKVMDVLRNEAFQEKAEADGKWRRATISQVQLCSYFSGFKEIYEFRDELKEQQGDDFKLKDFHEQFLSFGSAPVKYVKELYQVEPVE